MMRLLTISFVIIFYAGPAFSERMDRGRAQMKEWEPVRIYNSGTSCSSDVLYTGSYYAITYDFYCDVQGGINSLKEYTATSGFLCEPGGNYSRTKKGETGFHWRQISVAEYCRLRTKHKSNKMWKRDRAKARCVMEWGPKKWNNWFTQESLTFRCLDRRGTLKKNRDTLKDILSPYYEEYVKEHESAVRELVSAIPLSSYEGYDELYSEMEDGLERLRQSELIHSQEKARLAGLKEEQAALEKLNAEIKADEALLEKARERFSGQLDILVPEFSRRLRVVDVMSRKFSSALSASNDHIASLKGFSGTVLEFGGAGDPATVDTGNLEQRYHELTSTAYQSACQVREEVTALKEARLAYHIASHSSGSLERTFSALTIPQRFSHLIPEMRRPLDVLQEKLVLRAALFDRSLVSLDHRPDICSTFEMMPVWIEAINSYQSIDKSRMTVDRLREEFDRQVSFAVKRLAAQDEMAVVYRELDAAWHKHDELFAMGRFSESYNLMNDWLGGYGTLIGSLKLRVPTPSEQRSVLDHASRVKSRLEDSRQGYSDFYRMGYLTEDRTFLLTLMMDDFFYTSLPAQGQESFVRDFLPQLREYIGVDDYFEIAPPVFTSLAGVLEYERGLTAAEQLFRAYSSGMEGGQ